MFDIAGQDAVRDHRVDVIAEHREIRIRAARFGYDQPFRVHDEAGARDVAVGQQLAYTFEPVVEAPDRIEHAITCNRNVRDARDDRLGELRQTALRLED